MTLPEPDSGPTPADAGSGAPGAVPPTGGVPPEDAAPRGSHDANARSAADDLADGIDLMVRAARKALRTVDPGIEAAAARAVTRLQELDSQVLERARENLGAEQQKLETLAAELGRDITDVVKRAAERIDASWRKR